MVTNVRPSRGGGSRVETWHHVENDGSDRQKNKGGVANGLRRAGFRVLDEGVLGAWMKKRAA
jgi:hypothetical protein